MSFARPFILLLLALPLLLMLWESQRRGFRVTLPFDYSNRQTHRWLERTIRAANFLPHSLLAIAILLLAGPQLRSDPQNKRVLTNIEFCLDVSGSMTARFGDGSRYDAAMDAIREFTTYRKGDAFGLTIFGTEVLHWVPLTKDLSAIRLATPFLRPEKMPPFMSGTLIGKALRACQKILANRPEGDRMVILVTDGQSADLFGGQAQEIANEFRAQHIRIYTIHVAEGDAPEDMHILAGTTGGQVYAAGDPGALKSVFRDIDAMQKVRLKPEANQFSDFFRPFAIAGLSFFGLHLLSLFGVRFTPW